jgi:hypothetical protein
MKQHRWHKEIKAWADGAEIEFLENGWWLDAGEPEWNEDCKYRIKKHPKDQQYLYAYERKDNGDILFSSILEEEVNVVYQYLGKIKLEVNDDY